MILTELVNIENALHLDYRILACLGLFISSGIIFLGLGIRRFLLRKIISGSLQSLSGLSILLASLLILSIAVNLYTYARLTYEQDIADISFVQLEQQTYKTTIRYNNNDEADEFLIYGDEWQVDARVIKWHGWSQLLGLNANYRLERISGRYSDLDDERQKPRSVYSLQTQAGIDYWKIIKRYGEWIPWIDAHYGSATYLPMTDKSIYSLSLTQSGLIARAKNEPAIKNLSLW